MRALIAFRFERAPRALPPLKEVLHGRRVDRADPTWRQLSVVHCVPLALEADDGALGRTARELMRQHEREIARRLALRSRADRSAFAAVRETVERAAGPVGALALFQLVEAGRLFGRVLDELSLAPPELTGELVQQLATPASISASGRSERGAATVAMQLALREPAEYVRLVSGLASPAGEVLTRGNRWLCRTPGTPQRSLALRLLLPALLAALELEGEVTSHELAALQAMLFGRPSLEGGSEQLTDGLRVALAAGKTVAVELVWGTQGLCVALAVSSVVVSGTRLFTLWDAAGRITQLPEHELELRLVGYAAAA